MTDNVYFNPRKAAEEVKSELLAELDRREEEKANIQAGQKAIMVLGTLILSPVIMMLLWNWLMPLLFGLKTIGYFQAFGLHLLARLIFKHDD
jgi:uncharacterized membrane protein